MKPDSVIYGGTVVTGAGIRKCDIFIKDGRIAALVPHSKKNSTNAKTSIDARGRIVIPGLIDPHVHFSLPVGKITTSDNFESGTRSALCGGVTTIIDYTTQAPGVSLKKAVRDRRAEADGSVHCDYSLHCIIPSWKGLKNPARQLREAVKSGTPTFKMFMIYKSRGLQSDDADLYSALEAAKSCGGTICVHAESDGVLELLISRYSKSRPGIKGHMLSRPDYTEWEAVQRACVWAEATGGRLYVVHISAGRSAEIVGEARKRGVNVIGETCPQYLALTEEAFLRPRGYLYATCPQIKKSSDRARLWKAVENGEISVIATDSCTFSSKQKALWGGDFTKLPFGIPGVETSLPLIYTLGVEKGRISLEEMVRLMSTNSAKITGLYPRKGAILPGSDADITIINPSETRTVDFRKMQANCDWSPYQGMKLKGFAETVILRGEVAARNGKLASAKPRGMFIKRKPQPAA